MEQGTSSAAQLRKLKADIEDAAMHALAAGADPLELRIHAAAVQLIDQLCSELLSPEDDQP